MPEAVLHGTIESLVTDQGNGISYCSECHRMIDIMFVSRLPYPCPGCGAFLEFGGTFINTGGSD